MFPPAFPRSARWALTLCLFAPLAVRAQEHWSPREAIPRGAVPLRVVEPPPVRIKHALHEMPAQIELLPAPATAFDLQQFELMAAENHPALRRAWQQVFEAEGRAIQAGMKPNPQLNIAGPQVARTDNQHNVFVSQDIITGGKLRLAAEAANTQTEQARWAFLREQLEVFTVVRRNFYAALILQNRLLALREIVAIQKKSEDTAQRLLRAGEGTRNDVLLLQVEAQQGEMDLENAQALLDRARQKLAYSTGVSGLKIEFLNGDFAAALPQLDRAASEHKAALEHPAARIAALEVSRADTLLERAMVETTPNLNVMGGYQRTQLSPAPDQALFQVTIDVPLWNRNQGGIRAAHAAVGTARADARRVESELADQAADAFARYAVASRQVDRYRREILPRSRESLGLAQDLYQRGETDFLRLLQTQRLLVEAKLNYLDAESKRWEAAIELANLLQLEKFPW